MSLFEEAMREMKSEVLSELEERIWERLEPRIQQELHARHMSVAEVSQYLHVSTQTVRRLITSREIPHFRVRGQIFLRQTDIERWVASQIDGH